MTFSSVTDLKAKETIDLRYCYVNCLADGVIELQYVKESPQKIWYYVHCANRKEFSNWTRKFNELGYSKTVRNGSPENGSRAVSPTHENGSRPASPTRDVREMDGSRPASPTRDVREMDIVTGSVVPVRLPDPLSRHGTPRHDSSDRASSVNSTPAKDTPFEKPQLQRASSIMSRHKNRNSLHNRMQHVI